MESLVAGTQPSKAPGCHLGEIATVQSGVDTTRTRKVSECPKRPVARESDHSRHALETSISPPNILGTSWMFFFANE